MGKGREEVNRAAATDVLAAAYGQKFIRGRCDCFTLAADVVEALTGRPAPFRTYVGSYKSLAGAVDLLIKKGFGDLGAGFASIYQEIAPGSALLGDIGIPSGGAARTTIYIFDGQSWVSRRIPEGIGRVRLSQVHRAFRVA